MRNTRLAPEHRQAQILDAAFGLAEKGQLYSMRMDNVAAIVGVSRGTVRHHFGGMRKLRIAVIRKALDENNIFIVEHARRALDPVVAQ